MSTDTVPARANGQTIEQTWFNILQAAMSQEFCPRNSSGVPTEGAGSLGSETFEWLKVHVLSGGWRAGDIKAHHSYNGAVGPGHGWMLCDGRVIAEAAYNTEQGANTWATYVGTSPLDGKYLPDLTNKYLVGKATTTQTGSVAITGVGNASHQVALNHVHSTDVSNLSLSISAGAIQVYAKNATHASVYDSGGAAHVLKDSSVLTAGRTGFIVGSADVTTPTGTIYGVYDTTGNMFNGNVVTGSTGSHSKSSDSQLSATQSIQPASIEIQYYMRIIA